MKINLEINNLSKAPVKKDFFEAVVRKTLKKSGYEFLSPPAGGKNISVSLAVVSQAEIKKLNKTYRRKNEPTDILSFAEYKNTREIKAAKGKELFLGELILCYDDIKKYAGQNGLNVKKETARVVSHGVLHLLGLKHGRKMFSLQAEISAKI